MGRADQCDGRLGVDHFGQCGELGAFLLGPEGRGREGDAVQRAFPISASRPRRRPTPRGRCRRPWRRRRPCRHTGCPGRGTGRRPCPVRPSRRRNRCRWRRDGSGLAGPQARGDGGELGLQIVDAFRDHRQAALGIGRNAAWARRAVSASGVVDSAPRSACVGQGGRVVGRQQHQLGGHGAQAPGLAARAPVYSSSVRWKLLPPKPKELRDARRGCRPHGSMGGPWC